jgi:hypothetical protein
VDEELLELRVDWAKDPEGTQLKACLVAHLALERAQARLDLAVRLLVASSAVVWLVAVSPRFPPAAWRGPVLASWLAIALTVLGLYLAQRYWKNKLEDGVARLESGETPRSP